MVTHLPEDGCQALFASQWAQASNGRPALFPEAQKLIEEFSGAVHVSQFMHFSEPHESSHVITVFLSTGATFFDICQDLAVPLGTSPGAIEVFYRADGIYTPVKTQQQGQKAFEVVHDAQIFLRMKTQEELCQADEIWEKELMSGSWGSYVE